jgi:hypothetical protein
MSDNVPVDVHFTDHGNDSATATLQDGDWNYRFSVYVGDAHARVQYEETMYDRGVVRVGEPSDEVYRAVMASDVITQWADERGLRGVRRDRKP